MVAVLYREVRILSRGFWAEKTGREGFSRGRRTGRKGVPCYVGAGVDVNEQAEGIEKEFS